jgi:hypothetical protein
VSELHAECLKQEDRRPSTVKEMQRAVVGVIGDKPIKAVSRRDLTAFSSQGHRRDLIDGLGAVHRAGGIIRVVKGEARVNELLHRLAPKRLTGVGCLVMLGWLMALIWCRNRRLHRGRVAPATFIPIKASADLPHTATGRGIGRRTPTDQQGSPKRLLLNRDARQDGLDLRNENSPPGAAGIRTRCPMRSGTPEVEPFNGIAGGIVALQRL